MQTGYIKTSVSFPPDVYEFLKNKASETGAPISRLVAKAIRQAAEKETRRTKK